MIPSKSNGDYIGEAINLIIEGIKTSENLPDKNTDNETLEYLKELREKIVELLTGIFMFLTDHNQTNLFSPNIDGFLNFLNNIVRPEYKPDIQLIAEVCGLLGDLYIHFKASVELHYSRESLNIIYNRLEHSGDPQYMEILNYTKQVLKDF